MDEGALGSPLEGSMEFEGLQFMIVAGLLSMPLAAWKLAEIIVWVAKHLHWG